MNISATDIMNISKLLEQCSMLINRYCVKPCEKDKARKCINYSKKLNNKLNDKYTEK